MRLKRTYTYTHMCYTLFLSFQWQISNRMFAFYLIPFNLAGFFVQIYLLFLSEFAFTSAHTEIEHDGCIQLIPFLFYYHWIWKVHMCRIWMVDRISANGIHSNTLFLIIIIVVEEMAKRIHYSSYQLGKDSCRLNSFERNPSQQLILDSK